MNKNQYQREYNKKHPEYVIFYNAKHRCNNPDDNRYKYYGERGIEFHLTFKDIRYLMERDGYWNMKYPSIDRKDNDGNYTRDNCRFIELGKNVEEMNKRTKSKSIIQYDLKMNKLREWPSAREAEKTLQINQSNISKACKGIYKSAGGSKWRYK